MQASSGVSSAHGEHRVGRAARSLLLIAAFALASVAVACGDTGNSVPDSEGNVYPDVIGATVSRSGDGTWRIDATISSPYDTADRYADAWRVRAVDGEVVYGVRDLTHDHGAEQPFTRSLTGVVIPDDVNVVVVEGRDLVSRWGGATVTIELDSVG